MRVPRHEPLAHVLRGGMVESVHYGSMIVLGPSGEVRFAAGDPDEPHYPRSSLKPVQAAAMVRLGLDVPADLLALVAASHSGEQRHVDGARRLLARYDLTADDLRNQAGLPLDPTVRDAWVADGRGPDRLTQNCSGKHAGMLATARINGWSTEDYLRADHPVQLAVAATVAELAGEKPAKVAVDGCGAPLFALTMRGLARAIGAVASAGEGTAERAVADAMRAYPQMLGGTGRDVTEMIQTVPGVIVKDGAEGVQAAALPDGCAVAFKVSDGSARPRVPLTAAGLAMCGVPADTLTPFLGSARDQDLQEGVQLALDLDEVDQHGFGSL